MIMKWSRLLEVLYIGPSPSGGPEPGLDTVRERPAEVVAHELASLGAGGAPAERSCVDCEQ
jgi:hypothetical protein